jgi:hypothetical protein
MGVRRVNSGAATRSVVGAGALAAAVAVTTISRADEPRKVNEPHVLNEPAEVTQVVDAFDESDVFDLQLTLGFQHSWEQAKIRRETHINQAGLTTGGYTSDNLNVAEYGQSTSRLNTRADVGIYRDIALFVRMPIILSDQRELTGLDGSQSQQQVVLQGLSGEQLFSLPFESPKRSGIEYLALGLDFGIFNQYRDPTKPTWIAGFETRLNVSEPMHACNDDPADGEVRCAHPSDINRNGVPGEYPNSYAEQLEGTNFSSGRDPGVSRGTTGLELHSFMSQRIKYIEPYGGFRALFEFPVDSSDFGATDLEGSLVNHPPLQGSLFFGLAVIPWEIRDQFQRATIDMRFTGSYVSEGRDYSELFDALGSSNAASLRYPNFAGFQPNYDAGCTDDGTCPPGVESPSVVNPASQKVYFTGLTDVQQYGVYSLSSQFTWQAGEYVKFNVGASYTFTQSHLLTFDQACNPDFKGDIGAAGSCLRRDDTGQTATGIPNPNYRAVINAPGRRFKVDDSIRLDGWVNATVMF